MKAIRRKSDGYIYPYNPRLAAIDHEFEVIEVTEDYVPITEPESGLILADGGKKPFKTETSARGRAGRLAKRTGREYEVIKIAGGWAIRPKE